VAGLLVAVTDVLVMTLGRPRGPHRPSAGFAGVRRRHEAALRMNLASTLGDEVSQSNYQLTSRLELPRHARHAVTRRNFLHPAPPRPLHRRTARRPRSRDDKSVTRKPLICRQFRRDRAIDRVRTAAEGRRGGLARAHYTLGF